MGRWIILVSFGAIAFLGQWQTVIAQEWQSQDVGLTSLVGSTTVEASSDRLTLEGSGADIWGVADAFHYHHRQANGDGNFVVHVDGIENTHGWAKAGIMLRESLTAGSPHVMVVLTPANGVSFQRRRLQDERSYHTSITGLTAPQWLRLEKRGDRIWAYASMDGADWLLIGSDNFRVNSPYLAGLAVTSHRAGQLCTAEFSQLGFESDLQYALPAEWETGDVGATGSHGLALEADGQFTLYGAGADIWGNADAFHFTHRILQGDGVITARVHDVEPLHAWAKAGVMIRESLDPDARNAFLAITPARGLTFQRRVHPGEATRATILDEHTAPQWVRLQRTGDILTAFESFDGVHWQTIATIGLELPSHAFIGLAMTSHREGQLAEAIFTDVSIESGEPLSLPAPWAQRTIGDANYTGTAHETAGTFTLQASGRDIWHAADEFHYLYQPLEADGSLSARVISQTRTHGWAKAGLMIRETLEPGSRHAMIALTPDHGIAFQRRLQTDQNSRNTSLPGFTTPSWLKIERWGRRIDAYHSADGLHWIYFASETLDFDGGWIGFAVTSHNDNLIGDAVFEEVDFTRERPPFGLEGQYFAGADLTDLVLTRIDGLIDFRWQQSTPDPAIVGDPFSVRWSGRVLPEFSEPYQFSTLSDDGVRLWVGGQLLIDDWTPHSAKENGSPPVLLEAGVPVEIVIEYFDRGGTARMALSWQSASQPKQLVPPHRLLEPEDEYAVWERLYFGMNGIDPEADHDGDGFENFAEFENGTDPTDYYSRQDGPLTGGTLTVIQGGHQSGSLNEPLPEPIELLLTCAEQITLAQAPLTFVVQEGAGFFNGDPARTTLETRTDQSGRISVHFTPTAFGVGTQDVRILVSSGPATALVEVEELPLGAVDLAAGAHFSAMLDGAGEVICWGRNQQGELGTPDPQLHEHRVILPRRIVSIEAGHAHLLAIDEDGALHAWGDNRYGQCGGIPSSSRQPAQIALPGPVMMVAAGQRHSLALLQDGRLFAWGANDLGQLGDGTRLDRASPVEILDVSEVLSVTAGVDFTACVDQSGMLHVWGVNDAGQIPPSTAPFEVRPVVIPDLPAMASVVAGDRHLVARSTGEVLWVWGENRHGQTGFPPSEIPRTPAALPAYLHPIQDLATGAHHTHVLLNNGALLSWGANWAGQLGLGHRMGALESETLAAGSGVVQLAAGHAHTLALTDQGDLLGAGANWLNQLHRDPVDLELHLVPLSTLPLTYQPVNNGGFWDAFIATTLWGPENQP